MNTTKEYKLGIYTYYYDRQTRAWWAIPMGPRGQCGHAINAYTKFEIETAILAVGKQASTKKIIEAV